MSENESILKEKDYKDYMDYLISKYDSAYKSALNKLSSLNQFDEKGYLKPEFVLSKKEIEALGFMPELKKIVCDKQNSSMIEKNMAYFGENFYKEAASILEHTPWSKCTGSFIELYKGLSLYGQEKLVDGDVVDRIYKHTLDFRQLDIFPYIEELSKAEKVTYEDAYFIYHIRAVKAAKIVLALDSFLFHYEMLRQSPKLESDFDVSFKK